MLDFSKLQHCCRRHGVKVIQAHRFKMTKAANKVINLAIQHLHLATYRLNSAATGIGAADGPAVGRLGESRRIGPSA